MKPSSRRRVEREIQTIIKADGDRCSLCHGEFGHNVRTFGGVTREGRAALVAECCRSRLAEAILSGVYVNQDFADIQPAPGSGTAAAPADVERAISGMQAVFEGRAAVRTDAARRAGIDPARTQVFTGESDWKTDDMRWFEGNQDRSHRLRAVIGGEAAAFGAAAQGPMPHGHELQVLVRQIEPGKRVRIPFGRNLSTPIPDDERVLHALFDLVVSRQGDPNISSADVLSALAARRSGSGLRN